MSWACFIICCITVKVPSVAHVFFSRLFYFSHASAVSIASAVCSLVVCVPSRRKSRNLCKWPALSAITQTLREYSIRLLFLRAIVSKEGSKNNFVAYHIRLLMQLVYCAQKMLAPAATYRPICAITCAKLRLDIRTQCQR